MRAVNLLPRETKQPRKQLTIVGQIALVAPFVVAGLLAAGYLLAGSSVNSKRSTLHALQDELASLPAPKPGAEQNPALAAERDLRIAALGAALESRLVWDRVLREISAVLPGDVWLTTLSAQTPETLTSVPTSTTPAPAAAAPATTTDTTATTTTTTAATPTPAPAPAPAAGPMTFAGYTYSQEGVARLLSRLAVVPALQGVKLVSSTQADVGGQKVISFSIQANVRPQETG
jgi:Tfp pilus assembly protein PilN